jgi:hypothetical protein
MLMFHCFFSLSGVFKLALVDCGSYMAYVPYVTFVPGLCCFHGCFYGLDYVMLLRFELCVCLCLSLCYVYACFYATSPGMRPPYGGRIPGGEKSRRR